MLNRWLTKLVIWALKTKRLSGLQKTRVTSALLDNLLAINFRNIFEVDKIGRVFVHGRQLDRDQAISFRDGCDALKNSRALQIIHDQASYEAMKIGVRQGLTPEMIEFSKAALWSIQEVNKLIGRVVGDELSTE